METLQIEYQDVNLEIDEVEISTCHIIYCVNVK
jgi:hypothetical protein